MISLRHLKDMMGFLVEVCITTSKNEVVHISGVTLHENNSLPISSNGRKTKWIFNDPVEMYISFDIYKSVASILILT